MFINSFTMVIYENFFSSVSILHPKHDKNIFIKLTTAKPSFYHAVLFNRCLVLIKISKAFKLFMFSSSSELPLSAFEGIRHLLKYTYSSKCCQPSIILTAKIFILIIPKKIHLLSIISDRSESFACREKPEGNQWQAYLSRTDTMI